MSKHEEHQHEEGERHICPRMDENCRGGAIGIIGAIIEDYLAAHGTNVAEDKGNDEARKLLNEMLATLPTAEQVREHIKLTEGLPGGVVPEA